MDAVGAVVKENMEHKLQRKSKRETEFVNMNEDEVTDEKQEGRERGMIRDSLMELREKKKNEDEARNLIEEMQRNPDDAQNNSCEVEQKLNRILLVYIDAFDKKRGRPRL